MLYLNIYYNASADLVVILKHDMKQIPIIGWCMQMTLYLFLQVNLLTNIDLILVTSDIL